MPRKTKDCAKISKDVSEFSSKASFITGCVIASSLTGVPGLAKVFQDDWNVTDPKMSGDDPKMKWKRKRKFWVHPVLKKGPNTDSSILYL